MLKINDFDIRVVPRFSNSFSSFGMRKYFMLTYIEGLRSYMDVTLENSQLLYEIMNYYNMCLYHYVSI